MKNTKSIRDTRIWRALACMGTFAVAAAATSASAQTQLQRVDQKYRPEHAPRPIFLGVFDVRPYVDMEVEYIDNIFVSDTLEVDDVVLSLTPGVALADRRSDRTLTLDLSAGYESYIDGIADDRWTLDARGLGRFGLGTLTRTFVGFDLRRNELRSGQLGELRTFGAPLEVGTYGANAGIARDIGLFTLSAEGRYRETEYNGDLNIEGDMFSGDIRDFDVATGKVRAGYALGAAQKLYVEASYTDRDFRDLALLEDLPEAFAIDRSSEDLNLRAGFSRQLTNLLQLDVNAGIISQSFSDPRAPDSDSFAFDAQVFWNPTELTSVQFRGSRIVDTSTGAFFSGLLRTEGRIAAQHELLRNLVLTGSFRVADVSGDSFQAGGSEIGAVIGADYYISPHWRAQLRAERFERNSFFPGTQNRIGLTLRYNF